MYLKMEKQKEKIGTAFTSSIIQNKSNARVTQLQPNPQQLAWQENYADSGLQINAIFTDADLMAGNSANNADRGTFAHEYIQRHHGTWIKEYGVPPHGGSGWGYADIVKEKKIYEIKPDGGFEDAVGQATRYVGQANGNDPGHELAAAVIDQSFRLRRIQVAVMDHYTNREENDTIDLHLGWQNNRAGEVLYKWIIVNVSRVGRGRARDAAKPLMPSKKLKALVMPIIHNAVTIYSKPCPHQVSGAKWMTTSQYMSTATAIN